MVLFHLPKCILSRTKLFLTGCCKSDRHSSRSHLEVNQPHCQPIHGGWSIKGSIECIIFRDNLISTDNIKYIFATLNSQLGHD